MRARLRRCHSNRMLALHHCGDVCDLHCNARVSYSKESVQREWAVMSPAEHGANLNVFQLCVLHVCAEGGEGDRRLLVHIQRVLVNLCDVSWLHLTYETSGKDAAERIIE